MLRDNAFVADRNRRVPDQNITALVEEGLIQMLAPKRFGGDESDFATFLDVSAEIGRGCGSTAWLFGILGTHHWVLGHFPIDVQEELYDGKNHMFWPRSSAGRGGVAVPVEGGYRVSGHWGFASGIDHSDWVGATAKVEGQDDLTIALIARKSEAEVLDAWFTAGMRGTGSRDFVLRDVFVPKARTMRLAELEAGDTPGSRSLHQFRGLKAPFYVVLSAALVGPALGLATRAVAEFTSYSRERVVFGSRAATLPTAQMRVGRLHARLSAVRTAARLPFEEVDARIAEGARCDVELRLRQRRDAAYVVDECARIVDEISDNIGSRGQLETSVFQLIQRDIHMIRTHAALDYDSAMECYGRCLLGVEIPPSVRF
ncbi:acyl-CoA dehydrogenase family protein [Amorphus sp. 3PC139-8]|uniref:acyl-CoA dehydrogenase family protein n=1 Tax=Amorphus sp. 3PC139-8 TaxID=2735676 RepID=UPI00345DAF58